MKIPSLNLDKAMPKSNLMLSARSGKGDKVQNNTMLLSNRQPAKRSTKQDFGNLTLNTQNSSDDGNGRRTVTEISTPKLGHFIENGEEEDDLMTLSEIDPSERSFLGLSSEVEGSTTARNKRSTSPMIKELKDKGILIHGLQQLFEQIEEREITESRIFIVKCSYFEIYND